MNLIYVPLESMMGIYYYSWDLTEITADDILKLWYALARADIVHLARDNPITKEDQKKIRELLSNKDFLNLISTILQQITDSGEVRCVDAFQRLCTHLIAKSLCCNSQTIKNDSTVRVWCKNVSYHGSFKKAHSMAGRGELLIGDAECGCDLVPEKYQDSNESGMDYDDTSMYYDVPYTFINVSVTPNREMVKEALFYLLQRTPLPSEILMMILDFTVE